MKEDYFMYSAGTVHKILASVVTFQDDVFYPVEIVSPNDGVFFEAWVQRDTMELNETPDADNEIEIIDVRVPFICFITISIKIFRPSNKVLVLHGLRAHLSL